MTILADNKQFDFSQAEMQQRQKESAKGEVSFWKERITSASKLPTYEQFKKSKEEAKTYFKGQIFTEAEKNNWEGDTVQANLFRRIVNFMVDAVFMQNPNIHVRSRNKSSLSFSPKAAEVIEQHLKYVFEECDLRSEIRRIWKDAYFGNLSAAKIDFDRQRGLWRGKWVADLLILDPDARGDISRARWFAERVLMPRYRVWQDETFDVNVRNEIRSRYSAGSSITYSEPDYNSSTALTKERTDLEVIWYIYTKEGISPLKYGVNAEQDRQQIEGGSKNKLLIMCEGCDQWLAKIDDPTGFLDDDEFLYSILRLDELPGEFIGPALWEQTKAVVQAFNWAASYHMSDMRITAARTIAYNKNKIDDPVLAFKSRKHQVAIPCDGPPNDVVVPLDKGQADKTIFDSVTFFHNLLDRLTGIDEIARGEEGRTKTATESQILQQNSNISLRGPAAALDYFINDLIRKIGLATLYYTPAFSVVPAPPQIDPMTGFPMPQQYLTRQVMAMPVMDQMGVPALDPMGQPAMQQTIQTIPAEGATGPIKGIDYFHGDEAAMNWPQIPYEQIKCDINFTIEAGSSRFEARQEKKQEVTEILNTLGLELANLGFHGERWELWNIYLDAFQITDRSKILPPKEIFIQQGMMMQQMMMQSQQQGKGNPDQFKQEKNAGTDFPMNSIGGEQSSGAP